MKPLKIAMMSMTHGHTRKYYQVLKENPKLDWVAVSTANDTVKQVFLNSVSGIPCYDSDEAMLDAHPEIEAVVLASENSDHLRQMKLCAERGIHILSMKIPSFDMAEYDEMIDIIEKNDVICQVELELHYNPVVVRLKELLQKGEVGEIKAFNATNITLSPVWAFPWQGMPEKSYGKRVPIKEGDPRFRGGALCDHPHIFDMICEITGSDFDTIFAEVAPNIRPDIEEEDMLSVVGRMKNGALVSIDPSYGNDEHHVKVQVDWWKYPQTVEVFMSAVGTKGTLVADIYGKHSYNQGGVNGTYICGMPTNITIWPIMTQEFYECIRYGKKPTINLRWHYETIVAMNAAYESITTGKPVKVDATLDI